MENFLEETKKILAKMLQIMGIEGKIETREDDTGKVVNILTSEASFLIGREGANLYAFQHLARLLVGKKYEKADLQPDHGEFEEDKKKNFVLDVNNYRHNRVEMLKNLALDRAEQAAKEKRNFSFQPMTSYERRIIHLALKDRQDIICESEGMGAERHIVLKPI
jgi:spoIIIJ-associated protein